MTIKLVKNIDLLPHLECEGVLERPIPISVSDKKGAPTAKRLFSHHTLSSVRRAAYYRTYAVPRDSLDLILTSTYDHTFESFPEKVDVYVQPETKSILTWRRLKNTTDKIPNPVIPLNHPVRARPFGGIMERRSPHNIKLMNCGIHSALTNPGYSRKESGGMMYFY